MVFACLVGPATHLGIRALAPGLESPMDVTVSAPVALAARTIDQSRGMHRHCLPKCWNKLHLKFGGKMSRKDILDGHSARRAGIAFLRPAVRRHFRLLAVPLITALLAAGTADVGAAQGLRFTSLDEHAPLARLVAPVIDPLLAGNPGRAEAYLRQHAAPDAELAPLLEQLREISERLAGTPTARVRDRLASVGSDTSRVLVELTRGAPAIVIAVTGAARPRIAGIRAVSLPTGDPVTVEQRREVLDSLFLLLERHYVSPDTARLIVDHVRALDRTGEYAGLDREQLSDDVTHDLRAVNRDFHLQLLRASPHSPAAEAAPETGSRPLPDLLRTRRLDGDIGYLEIHAAYIPDGPEAEGVLVEALRELGDTRALILDLRSLRGGAGNAAVLLASHFLPPGVELQHDYRRATGETRVTRALNEVPGPRRLDVPLYILISRRTASAAEMPAFVLSMHARATIVGERTRGAGRPDERFPLPHGFEVVISVGRIFDPATGRGWEIVGVSPHVEVPAEDALDVALRLIERRCSAPHKPCG
jgi:hypothetical protein